MAKKPSPGIDLALTGRHGVTRDGQPLTYNRAPASDLAPWIARLDVCIVDAPADHRIDCGVLCDMPFARITFAGDWAAQTATGPVSGRGAVFMGPQTRFMPLSYRGGYAGLGVALRPGACTGLNGTRIADYIDRIVPAATVGSAADRMLAQFPPDAEPEDWLLVVEAAIRQRLDQSGALPPDPVTARFEMLAFADPNASVADFAREAGIGQRRLERIISRDFGIAPKQVLRRARALDMASHLRGVADRDEADELVLRYYDQSHMIRDFIELFGMSPVQFVETPRPILTLALELRQTLRLEALERLAPGAPKPWQAPPPAVNRTAS